MLQAQPPPRTPLRPCAFSSQAHDLMSWQCHVLSVVERTLPHRGARGVWRLVESVRDVDIVSIRSALDPDGRCVLLRSSDAVLANSRHELFGLVCFKPIAAGGIAGTGCSGEDYAVPGRNALVLETTDPLEFLSLFGELRANPTLECAIRRAGRMTAKQCLRSHSRLWDHEEGTMMSKPELDLDHRADEAFYAFIGRVSLRLVEHNVDAITAANFLREVAEAGGSALSMEQVMAIAENYVILDALPLPRGHSIRHSSGL